MSKQTERDYVLGTHDEEIARLGLQHRVWRPTVLDCWYRAGITVGSTVIDVGGRDRVMQQLISQKSLVLRGK